MLKDILLYLDTSSACEKRIDIALALARTHGAVLTGVTIVTHEFYQPRRQQYEARLAEAGALFRQKAAEAGVVAAWRAIESPVVGIGVPELLVPLGHCTDLIITGQEVGDNGESSPVAEPLVLCSGRPVLIVPAAGVFPTVGKRVLVAWKNGREAARSVNDALPVLKQAESVTLLAVSSEVVAMGTTKDPCGGILEHLQLHGVEARTELLLATSAPLADTLLNYACDGAFDLLVMGAFGAMPQRGAQLGPVAAQILREMTLPVLMAH